MVSNTLLHCLPPCPHSEQNQGVERRVQPFRSCTYHFYSPQWSEQCHVTCNRKGTCAMVFRRQVSSYHLENCITKERSTRIGAQIIVAITAPGYSHKIQGRREENAFQGFRNFNNIYFLSQMITTFVLIFHCKSCVCVKY